MFNQSIHLENKHTLLNRYKRDSKATQQKTTCYEWEVEEKATVTGIRKRKGRTQKSNQRKSEGADNTN